MKNLLQTLLILFISTSSLAQLKWESKASLPEFGVDLAASFTANGKVYFCGGRKANGVYSKDLWEFDPITNIWTKKTNYPGSGSNQCISFSIGNKGYVGMGASSTRRYTDFYEYNPTSNTWTAKTNFPGGVIYSAPSFVIGDTAYVVGGSCGGTTCYKNSLWMYVQSTNTWTQRANFPGGNRATMTAFSIGQFGYAGQGVSSSIALSNNYWKYNPATNSWTAIASFPGTARNATTSFTKSGLGYVGCGQTGWSSPIRQNNFYAYTPATDSWTNLTSNDDFIPRLLTQARAIDDSTIIIMGGRGDYGYLADVWQLKLNSDTCDYQDTTFVTDTTFINDTTFTTIYDTSYAIVKDTQTVYKLDTIEVYVIDTFYRTIFDTTYVTNFDTITTMIYDTVTIYTHDTITRYVNIAVEDTLNFSIYTDNCFNITHKLYPNPSSEMVYLFSNNADCLTGYRLEFIDAIGQILETKPYATLVSFDVRSYARALYFVRLIGKDGDTLFSKKVVIR